MTYFNVKIRIPRNRNVCLFFYMASRQFILHVSNIKKFVIAIYYTENK